MFLRILEFFRKRMTGRFPRLKLAYLWVYNLLARADKRLLAYKGIHAGERCFCIGTAPSLTLEDIELVKDEYSFSCNSIIKLYDKTKWRPTYFMMFDPLFYSLFHKEIRREDYKQIFYNKTQIPSIAFDGVGIKGSPEHLVREYMPNQKKKPFLPFSTDLMKKLVIGQSTIHSAVALAVWMGFKEIYLLGVDCDYTVQHAEGTEDSRLVSTNLDAAEMRQDFVDYRGQLEKLGVKLINASRGGKLDVLPCVELEDVLSGKAAAQHA